MKKKIQIFKDIFVGCRGRLGVTNNQLQYDLYHMRGTRVVRMSIK